MSQPLPVRFQLEEPSTASRLLHAGQRQITSAIRLAVVIAAPTATPEFITSAGCQPADFEALDGISLGGHPELVDERSQGQPLVVDRGVVPPTSELLIVLPGTGTSPSPANHARAIGICHLIRGVALQRGQHHIGASAQMTSALKACAMAANASKSERFPRRIDRRTESSARTGAYRYWTGRFVQVVAGNTTSEPPASSSTEVDRHYQVELRLWNVAVPHHILGMHTVGGRVGLYVGVGAQMPQYSAALARRADQVPARR